MFSSPLQTVGYLDFSNLSWLRFCTAATQLPPQATSQKTLQHIAAATKKKKRTKKEIIIIRYLS